MDEAVIRSEIEQGIKQVDPDLSVTEFSCIFDDSARKLKVHFTAKSQNSDETVEVSKTW